MGSRYYLETSAEAERVVNRLIAAGYEAYAEPLGSGFVVNVVTRSPSVMIEEIFVRYADSARRQ